MMLTRCPACSTTFRLTPEQVKARHGQVRCGRCQHVFDAIEFMVEGAAAAAPAVATPAPAAPQELLPTQTGAATAIDAAPASVEPATEPPPAVADAVVEETEEIEQPTSPGLDSVLLQPLPQLSPLSAGYLMHETPSRTPQWPWMLAALLALAALLLQAALAWRVELAARQPGLRPLLEALCVNFDCSVELPSDPAQLGIEASDLHPAPQQKNKLELTATLRNRAAHAQQWPHLEITLTDAADKAVVRKVITPAEYLPAEQRSAAGLTANAELAVQLLLDAGELPAAGYRLYLFYP